MRISSPTPTLTARVIELKRSADTTTVASAGLARSSETGTMASTGAARLPFGTWLDWWLTAAFGLAAWITVGFGIGLLISREDSEALESPLLLAVARELHAGPWELYGPFEAGNHLVLIHAPLYYHLSALLAWPVARLGVDPITASLVAGRSLSLAGLLAILWMAYRLARLEGTPARVGAWATLLVAGAPVLGSMPYTVRPDMLGIAFQTAGVLLVTSALVEGKSHGGRLLAAFAAFGLAFCTKQHFLVPAAISTGLLLAARRRGRIPFKRVERALLLALAIVVVFYGTEELLTGGRMSRAVFQAARSVGLVHPGSWYRAAIVSLATATASEGLLTLFPAVGFAAAWLLPGRAARLLGTWGAVLVLLALVLAILKLVINSVWLTIALLTTILVMAPFWLAAAYWRGRQAPKAERLDGLLWLYFAGEMAMVVALYRASTGAWINYAIQAAIFFAVLAGRALGRTLSMNPPLRSRLVIAAAALICVGNALAAVRTVDLPRRIDRQAFATLVRHERCAPSSVFVVDRPGINRLSGCLDLVYDDWLYPVFEEIGLAEPRAIWLRRILLGGRIQFVVTRTDDGRLDGIPETLPELGFLPKDRIGPFYAWQRRISGGQLPVGHF